MFDNTEIEVGREYVSDAGLAVRVIWIRTHAGTTKVWYRRSDGKDITDQISETWRYLDEFLAAFRPV
jgi:hypothetical protein